MSSGKKAKKAARIRDRRRSSVKRPESLRGVRPDRRLGQNFLVDEEVIAAIIEGSGVSGDDLVIEIGPGTGALTLPLAEKAGRVIAVELDDDMISGLRVRTFGMDNVEILRGDILETDIKGISEAAMKEHGLSTLRIIGNLPYYITTPIIMKLLDEDCGAGSITVMMQKEVADRIAAEPGTRADGAVTYFVHWRAEVTELIDVPRECFYPVPGVDSAVLRLDLREVPPAEVRDEEMLRSVIRAGFSMRRKTLLNALASLEGYDRETLSRALDAAGIDPGRRAESLTLGEFARLSDSLQEA